MKQRRTPFLCPVCGLTMTRVVETVARQHTIRRRRLCPEGHRVTTVERIEKAAA